MRTPTRQKSGASNTIRQGAPDLEELTPTHFRLAYRAPASLSPDPANPRRHPPKQIEALRASIRRFGFTVPVLVRKDFTIIAGHGRTEAALLAGLKRIPVWIAEHLSDDEARSLMIVDNRIGELAEWDQAALAAELKRLTDVGVDLAPFDLELVPDDEEKARRQRERPLTEEAPLMGSFWLAVEGPIERQAEAIAALKHLAILAGVTVHSNIREHA